MICKPCRDQKHEECPSKLAADEWMLDPKAPGTQILKVKRPPMALSEEGVAIQLSGLCPCQHKVPKVDAPAAVCPLPLTTDLRVAAK